jgi:hypothetical protein
MRPCGVAVLILVGRLAAGILRKRGRLCTSARALKIPCATRVGAKEGVGAARSVTRTNGTAEIQVLLGMRLERGHRRRIGRRVFVRGRGAPVIAKGMCARMRVPKAEAHCLSIAPAPAQSVRGVVGGRWRVVGAGVAVKVPADELGPGRVQEAGARARESGAARRLPSHPMTQAGCPRTFEALVAADPTAISLLDCRGRDHTGSVEGATATSEGLVATVAAVAAVAVSAEVAVWDFDQRDARSANVFKI